VAKRAGTVFGHDLRQHLDISHYWVANKGLDVFGQGEEFEEMTMAAVTYAQE
jgi:hypothetical protein